MPINPEFGKRVKQLRLAAGMLQKELATRVGMQIEYLSKIESGKLPPPSEGKIQAMAEILHCSVDELLILAEKLPEDISGTIHESLRVPQFLRTARGLKDDQWDELIALARRLASQSDGG